MSRLCAIGLIIITNPKTIVMETPTLLKGTYATIYNSIGPVLTYYII
jgi:hypothetical protein